MARFTSRRPAVPLPAHPQAVASERGCIRCKKI